MNFFITLYKSKTGAVTVKMCVHVCEHHMAFKCFSAILYTAYCTYTTQ